jgi:hypothetical protein
MLGSSTLAKPVVAPKNRENYKIVNYSIIKTLQDSLEKDSLLEFNIDQIAYVEVDSNLVDALLSNESIELYSTQKNSIFQFSQTHYSIDEKEKKIYSGPTYVSISQEEFFTVITILWGKSLPAMEK